MQEIKINKEGESFKYRLRHFLTGMILTCVINENGKKELVISKPYEDKIEDVSFFSTGSDSDLLGFQQYYKLAIGEYFIHVNDNETYVLKMVIILLK